MSFGILAANSQNKIVRTIYKKSIPNNSVELGDYNNRIKYNHNASQPRLGLLLTRLQLLWNEFDIFGLKIISIIDIFLPRSSKCHSRLGQSFAN